MPQVTETIELDKITTDISNDIDSDLYEVNTENDQEINTLDADLDRVLETPEAFLDSDFAELSPEVNQDLDSLSKMAADDDDSLRLRDGAGLDSGFVSRELPGSMRGLLTKSQPLAQAYFLRRIFIMEAIPAMAIATVAVGSGT